jgi:hypothetical protein
MRVVLLGAAACAAFVGLTACSRPSTPQVAGPLAIDIPELCSKCVEVLRCSGTGGEAVYVLDKKGMGAQIATIWDYMLQAVRPKTEDFRPLTVYVLARGTSEPQRALGGLEARLDVWQRRVELPAAVIDQKTGSWWSVKGEPLGACKHLSRADGLALSRTLAAAKPAAAAAGPTP